MTNDAKAILDRVIRKDGKKVTYYESHLYVILTHPETGKDMACIHPNGMVTETRKRTFQSNKLQALFNENPL